MKLLLAGGTLTYVVAQAAQPLLGEFGPWAQLGAVGVLGWIAIMLVRELRESRVDSAKQRAEHATTLDNICGRFDGWEQIRHADAEANRETLRQITAQCSRVQTEREQHPRKTA